MGEEALVDLQLLQSWVGRTAETEDRIDRWHAGALHATLGLDGPSPEDGAPLPEGWHWLYFRETRSATELGPDGHPARGGFLPPVNLPRRMWAGGRLEFLSPVPIGAVARRKSTIDAVTLKQGRAGPLVFVTVIHETSVDGAMAIREEHDIVYRSLAAPGEANGARPTHGGPLNAPWSRSLVPDPTLLFRYSALTFNGHRIHYDVDYCRSVEGYPGLIVHGPLIATLLLDLMRRNADARRITGFAFRARAALFCGEELALSGGPDHGVDDSADLAAHGPDGRLVMTATARLGHTE